MQQLGDTYVNRFVEIETGVRRQCIADHPMMSRTLLLSLLQSYHTGFEVARLAC